MDTCEAGEENLVAAFIVGTRSDLECMTRATVVVIAVAQKRKCRGKGCRYSDAVARRNVTRTCGPF